MTEKIKGWVMLPCFTVEFTDDGRDKDCKMTCNKFLSWIFVTFLAPFWSGRVYWKY